MSALDLAGTFIGLFLMAVSAAGLWAHYRSRKSPGSNPFNTPEVIRKHRQDLWDQEWVLLDEDGNTVESIVWEGREVFKGGCDLRIIAMESVDTFDSEWVPVQEGGPHDNTEAQQNDGGIDYRKIVDKNI
jgi:hypothetical protein